MDTKRKAELMRNLTISAVIYGGHWVFLLIVMFFPALADSTALLLFFLSFLILMIFQSKVYDWINETGGPLRLSTRLLISLLTAAVILLVQFSVRLLELSLDPASPPMFFFVDMLYFTVIVFDIFYALRKLKKSDPC